VNSLIYVIHAEARVPNPRRLADREADQFPLLQSGARYLVSLQPTLLDAGLELPEQQWEGYRIQVEVRLSFAGTCEPH
jgi:hypothetical protein